MTALSKQTSLFSYENLVHAIAGGCGSAFAMTTFYPLDIVRTRLQLEDDRKSKNVILIMSDIYKEEGLAGLYSGLFPVIESLYCSNFIYFYTFHSLKRISNQEKSLLKDLVLGMVAGCVNVISTNPLWVVNTRIKMQGAKLQNRQEELLPQHKYNGLIDGIIKLSRERGVKALWSGVTSSLVLVINPAIQFMTYEAIKARIGPMYRNGQLSITAAFLTGAFAKAVATVLTYPIQLVQAKQRHGHTFLGLSSKADLITTIFYIAKLQGARGLYKGMEAKIIQTVLTAALMFVCYEKITASVFSMLMKQKKL